MKLLKLELPQIAALSTLFLLIVVSLTGCTLLETWLAPGSPEQVPITEEEADLLLGLQDSAATMCRDLSAQEDPEFANKTANWLRQESEVSSVQVSEDNTVWIQYSCGLVGAVFPPGTRSRLDIDSALPQEREFSADERTLSDDKPQVLPLATVPTSKSALFLIFNTVRKPSQELRQTFEVAGYTTETCIGSAFTLQKLRSLGEYGVIYFNTHGGAGDLAQLTGGRLSKTFWIATGEKTTSGKLSEIWSAFTPGVGIVNIPGEQGTYIMFNQRFVDDIALDNALVINHACSSLKYNSMANAFLNSGAAVYIGWTNTTFSGLAACVTLGLLHSLKQPNVTFSEAWNAKAITFPEWSESYSIGELFPMTVLNDTDKDGHYCLHFRNGKIIGDDDDSGDDYVSDIRYRRRSGIDAFVLSKYETFQVEGKAFLEGTNNHAGITVRALGGGSSVNVLGTTTTNSDGSYAMENIRAIPYDYISDIAIDAQKEGYSYDFHAIRPPQGSAGSQFTVPDMVLHTQKSVTFDWVYQPDGTRSFLGSLPSESTTLYSPVWGEIWGVWGDNFCGFIFSTETITYPVADIYFEDERLGPYSFYANNGVGGVCDMGPILLENVTEAPLSGYVPDSTAVVVGHTYCVLTKDGSGYAKLRVTNIATTTHAQ